MSIDTFFRLRQSVAALGKVRAGSRRTSDPLGALVISVAVIDDHPIFREGLAQMIVEADEFELAGKFESVDAFARSGVSASLVLLDFHLGAGPVGPDAVKVLVIP